MSLLTKSVVISKIITLMGDAKPARNLSRTASVSLSYVKTFNMVSSFALNFYEATEISNS